MDAVGALQFEVTEARFKNEYGVDAIYESVDDQANRWVRCANTKNTVDFEQKNQMALATDSEGFLTYLAQSDWMFRFFMEKWPDVGFHKTRKNI